MKQGLLLMRKVIKAYDAQCKPLCQELKLPQTAFDILMFLGNNPEYKTASDIVEIRIIKANLVSVNVDKLVKEGYLIREADKNDRRKILLLCTEKAKPVIDRGKKMQEAFLQDLYAHIGEDERHNFIKTLSIMECNMDNILNDEGKQIS